MTSATFAFVGTHPAPALTTVLQPLDGDQPGAATYLRAMLALDYDNENAATNFLRGTLLAGLEMGTLVTGHDVWPNTSFRYTLEADTILVEERVTMFEPEFKTVFIGPLAEFINNQPGMMLHHVALYPGGRLGYYTFEQLEKYLATAKAELEKLTRACASQEAHRNAARRVRELQSLVKTVYQVEEPDAVAAC